MQANKLIAGFKKGPSGNLELMEVMFEPMLVKKLFR